MECSRGWVETMLDKWKPGWLNLCQLNQQPNDPLLDMVDKINKTTAHVGGCDMHLKDEFKIGSGTRASVQLMNL